MAHAVARGKAYDTARGNVLDSGSGASGLFEARHFAGGDILDGIGIRVVGRVTYVLPLRRRSSINYSRREEVCAKVSAHASLSHYDGGEDLQWARATGADKSRSEIPFIVIVAEQIFKGKKATC